MSQPEHPKTKEYSQCRKRFPDFVAFRRSRRPGFSPRRFAALSGIRSAKRVDLVVSGQRNLTILNTLRMLKRVISAPPGFQQVRQRQQETLFALSFQVSATPDAHTGVMPNGLIVMPVTRPQFNGGNP